MPSQSWTQNAPVTITNFSVQPPFVETSSSLKSSLNHSRTTSVRRTKPVDLWAGATSFGGSTIVRNCDIGQIYSSRNRKMWVGPISYWSSCFTNDLRPEVDLTFPSLDNVLRGRIKDSNLNLAQSVAEYRQVASMFGNAARDMMLAFRSLRSGTAYQELVRAFRQQSRGGSRISPLDTAHAITGHAANRWLEYQYGFRPMMSDIYGVADELAKSIASGYPRYVATSRVERYNDSKRYPATADGNFPAYNVWQTKIVSKRVKARYYVRNAGMKQLAQIGITNPALLVWELIPYSFVVDWMIPVGDWLSSLDALVGVEDLRVVRGYKITRTTETSCGGSAKEVQTDFQRSAGTTLALPRLAYRPSTSLTTVLNGLALLRQLR